MDVDDFFAELSAGVVRVDGPEHVGAGFVASANGLIVTCAHLLAGCVPGDTVSIVPHVTRQPLLATVELLRDPPDVAVLQLTTPLPPEVTVLQLGQSPGRQSGLYTFGYPKIRQEAGLPGELEISGPTADDDDYRQFVLHSDDVTLGFSGAPIWDPELHTVLGIIKSIATKDPGSRLRDTAIGVPAEIIRHLHPGLRNPVDPPHRRLEPLGVCFVSSEYPPHMFGGLGSHVEQLTAAIAQHIDVNIVLPNAPGVDYQEPPYPRLQLNPLASGDPSYDDPVSWLEFANGAADRIDSMLSDGASFDVIHCHNWVTVLAGIRCRCRYGIPLVFHVHLPNRAPLCASIENLGLACADLITVSSGYMREDLRRRSRELGLESRPIQVISNGVDLNIFHPREDWPADDGYILFVGRLVTQKGVEHLIRAFYYVLQKFPDIRLRIVGDGDLGSQLQRLRRDLLIPEEKIDFMIPSQWITKEEIAKLYQGARTVVVPSIYEPFGMTALEALACQCPVVASRTGGLRETIKDKVNGLLVEPEDALDLAQSLMTLLSDARLRIRLGEEGRRRLSTEYTWPGIARRVMKLYGGLVPMSLNTDSPQVKAFRDQITRLAKDMDFGGSRLQDLFDWRPRR